MAVSALVRDPLVDDRDRDEIMHELESEIAQLRARLAAFLESPADSGPRDEVAARFRQLAGWAAGFDWSAVAGELSRCEGIVRGAGLLGAVEEGGKERLGQALDQLAKTMKADREREATPTSGPLPPSLAAPLPGRQTQLLTLPAVVVGPRAIADMLRARGALEGDGYCYAVRHLPHLDTAHQAIRGFEPRPEAIVIDSDEPGADALIDDLLSDLRTEEIPIVVVGSWTTPEQAARYVALGAARCLAKPMAAGELRRACAQVSPGMASAPFERLGTMTLDQLGTRLSEELHRGLCDAAADDRVRRKTVDLGDGSEMLVVLWDALARIRELATAQTAGELRFQSHAGHAELPAGLALSRTSQRDKSLRAIGREERRAVEGSLTGYTMLVAEEDLSTNWFLSGVLREAGATVFDAFSGPEAIQQAFRRSPDAVIAALALPKLDGLTVARVLKNDVTLRDVPVLLLANDPAQIRRVHELGEAGARTILKGATGESVEQRVREVLRPRQSLAARIAEGGKVTGRLDELAPLTLVKIALRARPNARLTIHSGEAVYEIELRNGVAARACRTTVDGKLSHGVDSLAALLAVCAGRFMVESSEGLVVDEQDGALLDQLAQPIAQIRSIQAQLSGAALMRTERVTFRSEAMNGLLVNTPEPARRLLGALITGQSPRRMIAQGEAAPDVIERVLSDAARRLGIEAVEACDLGADESIPAPAITSAAVRLAEMRFDPHGREPNGELDSIDQLDQLDDLDDEPELAFAQPDEPECAQVTFRRPRESGEPEAAVIPALDSPLRGNDGNTTDEAQVHDVVPSAADPVATTEAPASAPPKPRVLDLPPSLLQNMFASPAPAMVADAGDRSDSPPSAGAPEVADDLDRANAIRESRLPRSVPRASEPPPALTQSDWRPPWAHGEDEAFETPEESERPQPALSPLASPAARSKAIVVEGTRAPTSAAIAWQAPTRGAQTPILVSGLAVSQDPPRRSTTPILSSAVRERKNVSFAALDSERRREQPVTIVSEEPKGATTFVSAASASAALDRLLPAQLGQPAQPIEPRGAEPKPLEALPPVEADPVKAEPPKVEAPKAVPAHVEPREPMRSRPAVQPVEIADMDLPRSVMPSSYAARPQPAGEKKTAARYLGPIVFAAAGVALALGARWWRYHEIPALAAQAQQAQAAQQAQQAQQAQGYAPSPGSPQPPQAAQPGPTREPQAAPAQESAPTAQALQQDPTAAPDAEADEAPVEVPLSPKERRKLEKGEGLLEIVSGRNDEIVVDGRRLGPGPVQRIAVSATGRPHEVRVKMRGEERVRYVTAKEGAKIRLRLAPPWSQ